MAIGDKIKSFRKNQKITQKQLSEATGLAEITIRQYEANKYIPKIENLRKLSAILRIPLSEFLELGQTISEYDRNDDIWDTLSQRGNGSVTHTFNTHPLTIEQQTLLRYFDCFNAKGKKEALKRIEELAQIPKYNSGKEPPTAE